MPIAQNLIRVTFITVLISASIVSICRHGVAADELTLPANAEDISPKKVGDHAPSFTVRTVDGQPYHFDPGNLERPTVLISFRGGWCPYCNMHLSELRHVIPQIKQAGFDVLFLSNDRPDQLYASLKRETQDDIAGLDYMILSDADLDAARALGTAFMIPDNLIGYLDEKGRDYQDSSIAKYRALAVPAVVLVDASGEIRFIYANPNYKIRLSAEELKAAADELLANMPK
jgi:peroxiredoxin